MAARTNRDVVDRYVAALTKDDLAARDAVLADDAIEVYPQSGERFRGRANLRAIIEQYPGRDAMQPPAVDDVIGVEDRWVMSPAFTVVKVAGGGQAYTFMGRVKYPSGEEWHLVQLLRVSEGRIAHITSYFAAPFEAPDWRAAYREG